MKKPVQYLESVDNALRLLVLLKNRDRLGVSDVATELGVAPSTAYRLLATLKYRHFVVQDGDRMYSRGPALAKIGGRPEARDLKATVLPYLDALRQEVNETVHLVVRQGRQVRFLASVECSQALRVTSRAGLVLPAHLTSGGKALLAELSPSAFDRLYSITNLAKIEMDVSRLEQLRLDLDSVRKRGYGVNRGESERGIVAVGMAIHGPDGEAIGAVSVSLPTARFATQRLRELVAALRSTRAGIEQELAVAVAGQGESSGAVSANPQSADGALPES